MIKTLLLALALSGSVAEGAEAAQSCVAGNVQVFGTVSETNSVELLVRARDGRLVRFNTEKAQASGQIRPVVTGMPVEVSATQGSDGALLAYSVSRAKPRPGAWGIDCL